MMKLLVGARPPAPVRMALGITAMVVGLMLAWTHAGFADGGSYHISADGVVRSDAMPQPTPTPKGYSYEGGHVSVNAYQNYQVFKVAGKKGIFQINRGGKPWATLIQTASAITVSDPTASNVVIVDAALAKPPKAAATSRP